VKRLNAVANYDGGQEKTLLLGKQADENSLLRNVVWIQEPEDGAVITIDLETGKIYNGHYVQ
jgi:pyruvate kinase